MLPTGQPLDRVVSELDVLLESPASYLAERPIEIGPLPVVWAAPGFGVAAGLALIVSYWLAGVLAGCALLFFVWWLGVRRHQLILRESGAEFVHGRMSLFVPWSVFRVAGRLVVREEVPGQWGFVVPINPDAVPLIELRQEDVVLARGEVARGPQWAIVAPGEALIPGRYEVASGDLAELFLVLGNRLGEEVPAGPPLVVAEPAAGGWYVVPMSLLRLPPLCAACAGPPDGFVETEQLEVPMCESCRDAVVVRQRWGGLLGMLAGVPMGGLVTGLLAIWLFEVSPDGLQAAASWGLLGGLFSGALVGLWMGRRLPVQMRHYSAERGVAAVRFDNPLIEEAALAPLRRS